MAIVKVPNAAWQIRVASSPNGPWVTVNGINNFKISFDKQTADVTTFDSNGFDSHIVVRRKTTITCEGFYMVDPQTGTRDPGQALVEEKSVWCGESAWGALRLIDPSGFVHEFSKGSFKISDVGGGDTEGTSWGFEFELSV